MSVVSVFVPCYNYAHYLRECVESVLGQTGVDVRILIIDDASPDNTPDVGTGLAAQDSRVEYRRHAENCGHIATYNEGIEWADGEYTVLLSADDMLTPGSLARATRLMDSHPEVGMVYGTCALVYNGEPRPEPRRPEGESKWRIHPGRDWLEKLCRSGQNAIWAPEAIVRTRLQKQLGGYRPELPHTGDMEMWMRFASHSDIGQIDADQAFYRVHGQNMHSRYFATMYLDAQERKAAHARFFDEFGDHVPDRDRLHRLANRSVARDAYWAACWTFDREAEGEVEGTSVAEIVEFAADTYGGGLPDLRHPRAYLGYLRAAASLRARTFGGSRFWPVLRPLVARLEPKDWYS